jgi:hypothetical protein
VEDSSIGTAYILFHIGATFAFSSTNGRFFLDYLLLAAETSIT